jgi:hypothetical protein
MPMLVNGIKCENGHRQTTFLLQESPNIKHFESDEDKPRV